MSGTLTQPLSAPGQTPAIGDAYFEIAWLNFFGDLAQVANAAAPLANPNFTGTVTVPILDVTGTIGAAVFSSTVQIDGNVGFYGTAPAAKPVVTGSRGSNLGFVVTTLLSGLEALGLIDDETTA